MPLPSLLPTAFNGPLLLQWFRFYFPLLTYLVYFIYFYKNKSNLNHNDLKVCLFSIYGSCLFLQAIIRYDFLHVVPTTIVAFIPLGYLFYQGNKAKKLRLILSILAASLYLSIIARPAYNIFHFAHNYSPWKNYSTIKTAKGIFIDSDREKAAITIDQLTNENDKIFVCNTRHDMIFISDPGFYHLSDRQAASFYHDLFPGIITKSETQRKIICELDKNAIKYLITVEMPVMLEANRSSIGSGQTILDDYIMTHYYIVEKFGRYTILHRKSN